MQSKAELWQQNELTSIWFAWVRLEGEIKHS